MPDVFGFKENKSKVPVLDKATYNPAGHSGQVAMASQLAPVAITTSQTVTPLTNATYIINASNIEVTLATNVQAGLKISVLALFAGSVKYGNQTDQLTVGDIADYIFNGTSWINLDKKLKNRLFPIGYIHISTDSTSPAVLFGGTWERIQDRFLLACGTTYQAGATGGEAKHTLTESEMPSHNHELSGIQVSSVKGPCQLKLQNDGNVVLADSSGTVIWSTGKQSSASKNYSVVNMGSGSTNTGSKGSTQSHNNMPPYLTVYMWKKTAN